MRDINKEFFVLYSAPDDSLDPLQYFALHFYSNITLFSYQKNSIEDSFVTILGLANEKEKNSCLYNFIFSLPSLPENVNKETAAKFGPSHCLPGVLDLPACGSLASLLPRPRGQRVSYKAARCLMRGPPREQPDLATDSRQAETSPTPFLAAIRATN